MGFFIYAYINNNMTITDCFILNDIKNHINHGNNVTHILNVKLSNLPSKDLGDAIREAIYKRIANTSITKRVNGMDVNITWRTEATKSTAYYHCDVQGMLGDTAVKLHSMSLLNDILKDIDKEFDKIFSKDNVVVAFLVTKPLARQVVLED